MIDFKWVVDLILGYKLKLHVAYLVNVKKAFTKIDTENMGFLESSGVSSFVEALDPKNNFDHRIIVEGFKQLKKARIHFSDAINILSSVQGNTEGSDSIIELVNKGNRVN